MSHLTGDKWLMAMLCTAVACVFGMPPPAGEGLDFARGEVTVREGQGGQGPRDDDARLMKHPLQEHLQRVQGNALSGTWRHGLRARRVAPRAGPQVPERGSRVGLAIWVSPGASLGKLRSGEQGRHHFTNRCVQKRHHAGGPSRAN